MAPPPAEPVIRIAPPPEGMVKRDASHLTKELLEREIAAGKTQVQVAIEQNVSAGVVSNRTVKYGLKWPRTSRKRGAHTGNYR